MDLNTQYFDLVKRNLINAPYEQANWFRDAEQVLGTWLQTPEALPETSAPKEIPFNHTALNALEQFLRHFSQYGAWLELGGGGLSLFFAALLKAMDSAVPVLVSPDDPQHFGRLKEIYAGLDNIYQLPTRWQHLNIQKLPPLALVFLHHELSAPSLLQWQNHLPQGAVMLSLCPQHSLNFQAFSPQAPHLLAWQKRHKD